MKSYVRYMVALGLLAAAPAAAQQNGRPGADSVRGGRWEQGGRQHRPAFQGLLAYRQELQLTDAQVTRLQEIGRRLEERNRPIRAQLQAQHEQFKAQRRAQMERLTPEQRRDTLRRLREEGQRREIPQAMRAPMEQMRANIRVAMEEAQGVLNAQQKERARQLMQEARRNRGDRMQGQDGHRRRGGRPGEGRRGPGQQGQQGGTGSPRP
jgi:acyl-CoA reductase-like NAD-dependent aldehyde dehydrogenase